MEMKDTMREMKYRKCWKRKGRGEKEREGERNEWKARDKKGSRVKKDRGGDEEKEMIER